MRAAVPIVVLVLLALGLAGCTASKVIRGDGQTIDQARAENVNGPKYRIAVGHIIDKTDPLSEKSLVKQVGYVNAKLKPEQQVEPASITSGIRDLITTELFNSSQFIVLERDTLNDALVEQEFSQSANVGDATRIPKAELEGAELLVVGALTSFDAGVQGGAIPIPIPLGKFSNGIGIVNLSFKRGFAAMDIRVIDTATGRIVASTAVEGKNNSYGVGLDGLFTGRVGYIPLPGVLNFFSNTPVEQALQKMVTAAIAEITKQHPSKLPPALTVPVAAPPPSTTPSTPPAVAKPTAASQPSGAATAPSKN